MKIWLQEYAIDERVLSDARVSIVYSVLKIPSISI